MYVNAFATCVKSFGREACVRADAANRARGKFMCSYNERTGATAFRDFSDANYGNSKCTSSDFLSYSIYDGHFYQDLKNWFVNSDRLFRRRLLSTAHPSILRPFRFSF